MNLYIANEIMQWLLMFAIGLLVLHLLPDFPAPHEGTYSDEDSNG